MPLTQKSAHRKDVGKIADLQHRHFATIATIIAGMDLPGEDINCELRKSIARQFADRLRATNPRFDRERFLRACQP